MSQPLLNRLQLFRAGRMARLIAVLPLMLASTAGETDAQESKQTRQATSSFDLDRALIADSTVFEPFQVTETRRLRTALDEGVINKDTPLLVMEQGAGVGALAFVVDQMAYHHIAQGEIAGEPWMVSF